MNRRVWRFQTAAIDTQLMEQTSTITSLGQEFRFRIEIPLPDTLPLFFATACISDISLTHQQHIGKLAKNKALFDTPLNSGTRDRS